MRRPPAGCGPADPLGRLLDLRLGAAGRGSPERYEVIGVAADAMAGWFFEGGEATVYLPAAVASPRTGETLVRWRGDAAAAVNALRAICHGYDQASMCTPMPLQSLLERQQVPFAIAAQVSAGLGILTLILACLGLYGLVSFTVVQRTREIGVRMALGATRRGVLLEILRLAGRPMALGAAIGLPACLALLALLESRVALFQTFDAGVLVAAPALLITAGLIAALLPAGRAASVNPLAALRHD